jgi:transmembrane sensor
MKNQYKLSRLYYKEILQKYLNNSSSAQELELLMLYFQIDDQKELENLVFEEISKEVSVDQISEQEIISVKKVHQNLKQILSDDHLNKTTIVKRLWFKEIAAAVVLIVCFIGLRHYLNTADKESRFATHKTIAPGTRSATLTLSNGQRIALSDASNGKIAQDNGVEIIKDSEGKLIYKINDSNADSKGLNILSTQRGETYDVILPDGSKVFLNAESSIKYSANFNNKQKRTVELTGEAYFEVHKNVQKPFVLKSKTQEIEVLGTHFNVSAYDNEVVKTTLLEGSVKVSTAYTGTANKTVILKPGQLLFNYKNDFKIELLTNPDDEIAWKLGYFAFDHKSIQEAMKEIARWYDVEIEYVGDFDDVEFGGTMLRASNIRKLLNKIELTGTVKFKVEGRRVMVIR